MLTSIEHEFVKWQTNKACKNSLQHVTSMPYTRHWEQARLHLHQSQQHLQRASQSWNQPPHCSHHEPVRAGIQTSNKTIKTNPAGQVRPTKSTIANSSEDFFTIFATRETKAFHCKTITT
uniref:Uncharacterized protein n=1 Tax=Physcomitrium patens TaxID=3218 RepID=A0A2K1IXY8_PHYPA|nr:hypothetical protein PHYPA_023966 [Physcomitrium patens]